MARPTHLALVLAALASSGCGGGFQINLDGGVECTTSFGTSAAARSLNGLLAASAEFTTTANQLDASLLALCTGMATDLQIPASELAPTGDQTATQAACTRVATQIRADLAAVRAEAGVQVVFGVVPPACEVRVEAYSSCIAECDATFVPGMATLQCEGGELRGTCSGSCTGRCAADVTGMCAASCEGTCTGSCTGTCEGSCDGTCATRGLNGACAGACMGTCNGTCSAGCTGSCSGRCVAAATASCTGECRGACSVAFTQPRCTGRVVPPMVDAHCRASCDARVNAQATCTPARFTVDVTGTVSAAVQARATRVTLALRNRYGDVLTVAERLRRLALAGQALGNAAADVSTAFVTLGVRATTCAAQAATSIYAVVPRVTVSVDVSVQVTGSIQ